MSDIPVFSVVRGESHNVIVLDDYPEFPFYIREYKYDDTIDADRMDISIVYTNGVPNGNLEKEITHQIEAMILGALKIIGEIGVASFGGLVNASNAVH